MKEVGRGGKRKREEKKNGLAGKKGKNERKLEKN